MRQHVSVAAIVLSAVLLLTAAGAAGAIVPAEHSSAVLSDNYRQQNEQPTASFSYSPSEPEPGEAITLNGSASSDPDGEITEYRWDLNGDGQTDTTGGPNARVAFPSAGVYEVTLTVVDDDGATDSVTNEIVVVGDIPPIAVLTVSATEIKVGEPVTFNATGSSDPDGQIETWSFDLNGNGTYDRSFESPPIFRTNYKEPGTYEVTLQITDNDGLTNTTTVELVVEETTPETVTAAGSPETVTTTVTVTPGTATSPGKNVGTGPNAGGGGLLSSIPGGGLGLAAIVVVLLLIVIGGILFARGSGGGGRRGGGGARRRQTQTDRRPITGFVLALLISLILIGGGVAVLRGRIGSSTAAATDVGLAFVELAALFLPALMLLLFVWFRIPGQQGQRGEATVGPLSAAGFRVVGGALGFLSLVLIVVGLAGLLLVLNIPSGLAIAGGLIVGAIGLTAVALALAVVYMAMG